MFSSTLLIAATVPSALAQVVTETLPIIFDQRTTARCYGWLSYDGKGTPPTQETDCVDEPYNSRYGEFYLGTSAWDYPANYQTSPGYSGYVNGANGSDLTVALTNDAIDAQCIDYEVCLSFDYTGTGLNEGVNGVDLSTYDAIVIEYDVHAWATPKSQCSCQENGKAECVDWWKSQLTTDILFWQGPNSILNVLSVRNYDPQDYPPAAWNNSATDYRFQFSDHQIQPTSPATAHVTLDAKYLMEAYSSQLCQGGGIQAPIHMRAIEFVTLATAAEIGVEISNVTVNAYKYQPGTFTPSAMPPACTPSSCPTQPTDASMKCGY